MSQLNRLQVIKHLGGEQGQRLTLVPMWREVFGALDDDRYREYLLRVIRQSGKSRLCAAVTATELLCVPGSYTLLVAASEAQTRKAPRNDAQDASGKREEADRSLIVSFSFGGGADTNPRRAPRRSVDRPFLGFASSRL